MNTQAGDNEGIATEAHTSGPWLIVAAAVLWGTTGTAQAFAPAGASPPAVGVVRLVLGGTLLLALAWGRGALRHRAHWPRTATAAGMVSMAAYQLCFFSAVARTGVAAGTVVAIGSGPVIAGLLGALLLHERPTGRWVAATALAVSGGVFLTVAGRTVQVDVWGIVLAVGAGAAYAVYTIASKRLLRAQPPDAVTGVVFFGGALLLLPLLFFVKLDWLWSARGALVALHLGVFATALAYILYIRGLLTVPAATAVTLALVEPATAALLGVFVLGERLPPVAFLGIGLIAAALAVLTWPGRTPPGYRQLQNMRSHFAAGRSGVE